MMGGRCAAEYWAEFGDFVKSGTPSIKRGSGTDVFICTGSEEVYVFNTQNITLRVVLQLPAEVRDLVVSHDDQLSFVACRSGVYCVSFSSSFHSASEDAGSGPAEMKISSEFSVVAADGVSSLLLVGSVLSTLCQTDTSWLLTLYKAPRQSKSNPCDSLSSFSSPLVSTSVQGDTVSKTVSICVYFGEMTTPSSSPASSGGCSSHFLLQPVLFKLLFGVEATLSKSPVILCGLPDGRSCFLPSRLPGSRLRILHSLEQPVAFVGASAVMETDDGCAGCLIASGKQGRVLSIKAGSAGVERGGGRIAVFTEGCVPGPVECVCVDKSCLYYSTASDLLTSDSSDGSAGREGKEGDEEASRSRAAAPHRPISLNVNGVIALDQPTCNAAGEVQSLSVSIRGQSQRIRLPVRRPHEELSMVPPAQVGRSVGDLSSAIGDVCERASASKSISRSKNQTSKQSNQVINISFSSMESPKAEGKPIRCHGLVRWNRSLQQDSSNLTCVSQNSSAYASERGWTSNITVFPSSREESSSVSHSFPFRSSCPGESLEVSSPVAAAASFPVTVTCSLIFSLRSCSGGEGAATFSDRQNDCFSSPSNTSTVDWSHASRVMNNTSSQKKVTSQSSSSSPADIIQGFINSRRIGCRESDGPSRTEEYSASVCVSPELLRDTSRLKRCDPDQKGSESAPQSSCVSSLEWLLSIDCGGVKMEHKRDKMDRSSSVLYGLAANNATVKSTAKEVNLEDSGGKEESSVCIEVQVESSSVAAVCGLHHAVLRRLQTSSQNAPEKGHSSKKVPISSLRQALQRAENSRGQISEALSVGVSSGQTHRILLRVYQQLRDSPLLMV